MAEENKIKPEDQTKNQENPNNKVDQNEKLTKNNDSESKVSVDNSEQTVKENTEKEKKKDNKENPTDAKVKDNKENPTETEAKTKTENTNEKETNNDKEKSINQKYSSGDAVNVYIKVVEGNRTRTQMFDGIIIAINNAGVSKTITVRKISYGIGVERVFPIHSPQIHKIEIIKHGKVRRAKLYYLRKRSGKATRIAEKI